LSLEFISADLNRKTCQNLRSVCET